MKTYEERLKNWVQFAENLRLADLTLTPEKMQEVAAESNVSRSVASALHWAGMYDKREIINPLKHDFENGTTAKVAKRMMYVLKRYNATKRQERQEKAEASKVIATYRPGKSEMLLSHQNADVRHIRNQMRQEVAEFWSIAQAHNAENIDSLYEEMHKHFDKHKDIL